MEKKGGSNKSKFNASFWIKENYYAIADILAPSYMDARIQTKGFDWGLAPSKVAKEAFVFLRKYNIINLFDLGCGYGRDSLFFLENGINCTGIDHSKIAIESANFLYERKKKDIETRKSLASLEQAKFINADFRSVDIRSDTFDAVYASKTFHQFRKSIPEVFVDIDKEEGNKFEQVGKQKSANEILCKMGKIIKPNGLMILATYSKNDYYFMNRSKFYFIEDDTYDARHYRPITFYSKDEIESLFKMQLEENKYFFEIMDIKEIEEIEHHMPPGKHIHKYWFVIAVKKRIINKDGK